MKQTTNPNDVGKYVFVSSEFVENPDDEPYALLADVLLENPAANAEAGITAPATFRALIWKFSIIVKA